MAPTRPKPKPARRKEKHRAVVTAPKPNPRKLLADATRKLEEGAPEDGVRLARAALDAAGDSDASTELAALHLLGEAYLELGEAIEARKVLERAVELDPEGRWDGSAGMGSLGGVDEGAGADKFLNLAQICETEMFLTDADAENDEEDDVSQEAKAQGDECIRWYERGAEALRRKLQDLSSSSSEQKSEQQQQQQQTSVLLVRRKLATALCAQTEAWMSNRALNMRPEAEARCEALVSEATLVAPPTLAEPWATLASVRISQSRKQDAREALRRYLAIWMPSKANDGDGDGKKGDGVEDDREVPSYQSRVAAARLFLEVGMRRDALAVLEGLLCEEDGVVEVWYLGGWALYLLGGSDQQQEQEEEDAEAEVESTEEERTRAWKEARRWLRQCLKLFDAQDYYDEAMREHAKELLASIAARVGTDGSDDDDEWEDEEDGSENEDEEMEDL